MIIDNKNDRSILFLLQHKEGKAGCDTKRIAVLEKEYPDYERYESGVKGELFKAGYLRPEDLTPDLPREDENGNPNPDKRYSAVTTDSGIVALKTGVFKSELQARKRERATRLMGIITAIAAIVAAVVGAANLLCR